MKPNEFLKYTKDLEERLSEANESHVDVGLPEESVSGKVYGDGTTVIKIGSIHEFGADFIHPGGTRYIIKKDGMAKFVSNDYVGPTGVTGPHAISIPKRSFLKDSFETKKGDLDKLLNSLYKKIVEDGLDVQKALKLLGIEAVNISTGAFRTNGYGKWEPVKHGGTPLLDTGTLRNSITYKVRKG